MKILNTEKLRELALAVIHIEAEAIMQLAPRIDQAFVNACQLLLNTTGRIVVMGMGKSGHVANKLAATLASTGSPAFFVHPGEACHGDMGMIKGEDTIIALSNSGNTPEILTLLPLIKRLGCNVISLTGNPVSAIAESADINLDVSVSREACPLGLAPTSSSTAALVMGDALAIALLEARGFTKEDFARTHPGGTLGKRLLLHVSDIMHTGDKIPRVGSETLLQDALLEMNRKQLGLTTIVDAEQHLLGIFTDGDIRRSMDKNINFQSTKIIEGMTTKVKTVTPNILAVDAMKIMEANKITSLVITDEHNVVQGVLHMHDLLKAGV